MRTISPRSYHPDVHDSDMQDTPRAPSGFLGRDHSPSSVHNYRDPLSHYRSNARESNDRFASTRDNRQSTSSSESSNDDNEQRKDGTGSVRSPWRDSFVLEQRRQSIQSYFNRGSPLPPYALDAPAFTLSRRPSQNWVHPGNRMTDDNGVTTIPLEFRPMQSTPVVEDRVRISGLPRDTIGDGDHQDHRRYHGSRSLAGIQAYYPYPHPDFLRLPAPLGEPRGKSGHTTSTQRVPPRLRTSQACEKCRKRKVKVGSIPRFLPPPPSSSHLIDRICNSALAIGQHVVGVRFVASYASTPLPKGRTSTRIYF